MLIGLALFARTSAATSPSNYVHRGADRLQADDLIGANDDAEEAIKLNPKDPWAYWLRAAVRCRQRSYRGAIADDNRAIELSFGPARVEAFINRGLAKGLLGDKRGEKADYDQAATLDPQSNYRIYRGRALARSEVGNHTGAIDDANHCVRLHPDWPESYNTRGNIKDVAGDLDGAVADYNRVLELDPKAADVLANRSSTKAKQGDLTGALTDLERAIEFKSRNEAFYLLRHSIIKRNQGDFAAASADTEQAIKLAPDDPNVYVNRANLEAMQGDLTKAEDDVNRALAIDPKHATAYERLGVLHGMEGRWAEAFADFQNYGRLGAKYPKYAHLYVWVAQVHLSPAEADQKLRTASKKLSSADDKSWAAKIYGHLLGKLSEAQLLAAAASANPQKDKEQHCEAYCYIGMKKVAAGDKVAAEENFRRCLESQQKNFIEYGLVQAELNKL